MIGVFPPQKTNSSSSNTGLQGTWDASTNTPALANTDTGKTGVMYQVSVGGTVDFGAGNITFEAKDIVVNNGTVWDKIDGSDAVLSVSGKTGIVTLTKSDVGLPNVPNADTTNATNISSGTLADARLSSTVTKQGNTFNGASQLVQLDASSKLPAVDGSNLTGLGGGGGTVQDPTTKAIKVATEVGTTGNARGTNAVDLQVSRATASQVASGTGSFQAGGNCTASGNYSTASGYSSTASGYSSTASGISSTASGYCSTASGYSSTAYLNGQFSNSNHNISSSGDSQYSFFVVRERTTDATPIVMTLGADDISTVRAVLPSGKSWRFVIELVAKNTSNGDTFAATYIGAIKRVGSTTSLIGTVTERDKVNDAGASTWSVAVTANDTNESLDITVTGEAAKTINWCAVVHLTEVA